MKFFTLLTIASGLLFFQLNAAIAQDVMVGEPGQAGVTYQQASPVVPNPRKAAYEQKQQDKMIKATQDAEAAKHRLQQGAGVAPAPQEEPIIRRYDPTVRDAVTGKEVVKKKPAEKKQTAGDRMREKYKKKRDANRTKGKLREWKEK